MKAECIKEQAAPVTVAKMKVGDLAQIDYDPRNRDRNGNLVLKTGSHELFNLDQCVSHFDPEGVIVLSPLTRGSVVILRQE